MTGAKICGLTTSEAVAAAVDGGAAYLGFVFYARSSRNIDPKAAGRLAEPAQSGGVKIVAVTVNPTDDELAIIAERLRPDLIQLHGHESPGRVAEVHARTGAGTIKGVAVSTADDLDLARPYLDGADHVMFEAKPPAGADLPGGNGATLDWPMLSGLRLHRPWFLAGGLDPSNVAEAVRLSGAPLVDVSSGVESAPGVKQPALITAFLDAVRRT